MRRTFFELVFLSFILSVVCQGSTIEENEWLNAADDIPGLADVFYLLAIM